MTEIYSVETGPRAAPPLVLLNSLGATHEMWDAEVARLSAYYRVILFDTRGHGQSAAPVGPYRLDDLIEDVVGVLDRHAVQSATVMGLSLGGMTALGLGLRHPERVRAIICCAARADAPPPFVETWHKRLALLETGGIEAVWEATRDMWLSEATRRAHPERVAALREGFLQTTAEGYRGCAGALMGLDLLRHLPRMRPPVLYVAGARDMAASPATMEEMAAATPGATLAVIEGAAHILNHDRPEEFALTIAGALGLHEA